jgi:hypothetical protein
MIARHARRAAGIGLLGVLAACHSGGPYGFATNYVPLSAEEDAVKSAREYDPVMYQREADDWRKAKVSLFGIVTAREPGPGGTSNLTLSVRRLATRNLCSNRNDEDSCRVTVTDKDFGIVHALAALRPEDDAGEHSVTAGSLVRVVGQFGEDVDHADAAPIMRATFDRHWPRHFFVTISGSDLMRQ